MIRVLYDHQAFVMQSVGGISRYYAEMMHEFGRGQNVVASHSALLSRSKYRDLLPPPRPLSFVRSRRWSRRINTAYARFVLTVRHINVLHPTFYWPDILALRGSRPVVMTVFDMIHETFPDMGRLGSTTIANKRALAMSADRIIAISEVTKRDLMRILAIPSERITVVHLATSLGSSSTVMPSQVHGTYVLFVGIRGSYKNFGALVEALRVLPEASRPNLVCVGGGAFTAQEHEHLNAHGAKIKAMHIASPDDDTLAALYRHAACFVFPSRYEGFGIPILEAFACQCPVVAANCGSLPEVAADAALYAEPDDHAAFAACIEELCSDPHTADAMRRRGELRLKDFSWAKTAAQTADVYRSALHKSR